MLDLGRTDRRRLLQIARGAIEEALCEDVRRPVDLPRLPAVLCQPAAAFVTLRRRGELRGCIGMLRFETPLWENVREAAVSAALGDPRFRPVRSIELGEIDLEVSVLDPPVPLPDPAAFVPGRHGIIVERGVRRALLLPQVATEQGWGTREMLDAVCEKAWLPADAWRRPGTSLYVFDSICFSELDGPAAGTASEFERSDFAPEGSPRT